MGEELTLTIGTVLFLAMLIYGLALLAFGEEAPERPDPRLPGPGAQSDGLDEVPSEETPVA